MNRFVVMLTDNEVRAIEDHRFANRIATKADAVRQLISDGLASKPPLPLASTKEAKA